MKQVSMMLEEGNVYSRKQLMELFNTKDSSLQHSGIYKPKNSRGVPMDSILLFVNEKVNFQDSSYMNFISGNSLVWTGQRRGRRDYQIIEHEHYGIELLVFHRNDKFEFPGYGYKYLGPYKYISHLKQQDGPNIFRLERVSPQDLTQYSLIVPKNEIQGINAPNSSIDECLEKEMEFITRKYHTQQARFSESVKHLDNYTCVVSGNKYLGNLEVGHVKDVRFQGSFTIDNGLTFTRNIHAAFDRGHVMINPDTLKFELNFEFPLKSEIPLFEGKEIEAANRIDHSFLEFKYNISKTGKFNSKAGKSPKFVPKQNWNASKESTH